jgi:predicted phage terminase large subunit-like protein
MEGESIWPKRFPVSELEKIKVEVGSAVWASQYMQMPLAPDAQIFSEEMLSHTYSALPKERIDMPLSAKEELMLDFYGVKPRVREIITIQALDSALKYGAQHDRSALVTLVSDGVSIFVADAVMGRFPFADLKLMVREQYKKWKPSRIFCEDVGSGTVLLEEMKREAGLLPLVPITPLDSKVSRAESVLGLFESGKIKFPERGAHWKADAINELLRFSEHCRHDDFTDALVHGIRQLRIFFEKEVKAHRQRQRVLEIEADWMHV